MGSWTYEKAGVPHLKGDPDYNRKIIKLIRSTKIPGVLGNPSGFAALFDPRRSGLRNPLIVSSTDGVGTKLEVAMFQRKHDTIGIDLVAMCVNDIITCGARPVFFLDYFATGKFHPRVTGEVLKGIVAGCREAGCALVGGETAIMPGFYRSRNQNISDYDVAGFSIGLVEKNRVIDGSKIRKGDVLLGIASSGFHSNGFSLLRRIFSKKELSGRIGKELLTPTRIYVKPVLEMIKKIPVSGLVNITGGGFIDNLPRVIPSGLTASIDTAAWCRAKIFQSVQDSGNISNFEMMRTFNLGIGFVVILKRAYARHARKILSRFRLASWVIGEVIPGRALEVK